MAQERAVIGLWLWRRRCRKAAETRDSKRVASQGLLYWDRLSIEDKLWIVRYGIDPFTTITREVVVTWPRDTAMAWIAADGWDPWVPGAQATRDLCSLLREHDGKLP